MAKNKETTGCHFPCLKPAFPPAPNRFRPRNRAAERRGRAGGWGVKDDFRTLTCETRAPSAEPDPLGCDPGEPAFGCGGPDVRQGWVLRFAPQALAGVGLE